MDPSTSSAVGTQHRQCSDPEGFQILTDLALNLRWSWNHTSDDLWRKLDAELWERTRNPWVVLQTTSRDQIDRLLADHDFRETIDQLEQLRQRRVSAQRWFQTNHSQDRLTGVAYFSMEFMLSEALPIYSGGLGNVAGDQLKAASDLGVPVVGVGLLYQQGYFRQRINAAGEQEALYPYNDPGQLPIAPVRRANGEWLRLEMKLHGSSLWLRAWQVQVGKLTLYLLDSNDPANYPVHRGVISELYGGGPELRLQQEILLGIGGWRLLEELGLGPEVCHLNEGHAAFAVLERARGYMQANKVPFEIALAVTRAGNLFTTHTAVVAGFDRFSPALIEQYLSRYAEEDLGITLHDLLALGRQNPNDASESFNMAYLATRGSGSVNGVSRLHEQVSHQIFQPLYARWPQNEIPVGHVTNGVHMPSWDSYYTDILWTEACGQDRWLGSADNLEQSIRSIPYEKLWKLRSDSATSLVDFTRNRLARELADSGASPEEVSSTEILFNPGVLTLGFARRFATYKRPNLLLHDPERLLRLLSNPERPVQLFIAGKAHPEDKPGQDLIHEWISFIRRPDVRPHIAFLSDYDMQVTEQLVRGVDVWINTPRRPWEASGTSGMKVLVNGGLNLSELDGWWAEAYSPEVGWALGDGQEHGDDPAWDAAEAEALYELLEQQIIPEFYSRDASGIPKEWVHRIRESMAVLTPRFSADRTVREYTEKFYLPAASAYRQRNANDSVVGKMIDDWRRYLDATWDSRHFGKLDVNTIEEKHIFEVEVLGDDARPLAIRVELYAAGDRDGAPSKFEMKRGDKSKNNPSANIYTVTVPATRPTTDYTPRIIPHFDGVSIPLEDSKIIWQK